MLAKQAQAQAQPKDWGPGQPPGGQPLELKPDLWESAGHLSTPGRTQLSLAGPCLCASPQVHSKSPFPIPPRTRSRVPLTHYDPARLSSALWVHPSWISTLTSGSFRLSVFALFRNVFLLNPLTLNT